MPSQGSVPMTFLRDLVMLLLKRFTTTVLNYYRKRTASRDGIKKLLEQEDT